MKLYFRILAIALFATVTFSACSKNKEETLAITKDNLAGTYVLTSIMGKASGQAEQDITSVYYPDNCQHDDEFVLFANMEFDYVDAGITCNFGGSYSDTWLLKNNEVYFDEVFGTVTKLTAKEMVIRYTEGNQYIIFYFTRKL